MCRAILIALGMCIISAWPVLAFHDKGVADCSGCHTMHNSEDGAEVAVGGPYDWLLTAEKPSDVCLGCHATGLGAVFVDDPLAPSPLKGGETSPTCSKTTSTTDTMVRPSPSWATRRVTASTRRRRV